MNGAISEKPHHWISQAHVQNESYADSGYIV